MKTVFIVLAISLLFKAENTFAQSGVAYSSQEKQYDSLQVIEKAKMLCILPNVSFKGDKDSFCPIQNLICYSIPTPNHRCIIIRVVDTVENYDFLLMVDLAEKYYPSYHFVYGFEKNSRKYKRLFLKLFKDGIAAYSTSFGFETPISKKYVRKRYSEGSNLFLYFKNHFRGEIIAY